MHEALERDPQFGITEAPEPNFQNKLKLNTGLCKIKQYGIIITHCEE
jgi:hypothetical protein